MYLFIARLYPVKHENSRYFITQRNVLCLGGFIKPCGPILNGKDFLNACLKEKTIVVPGVFFDVNPGKRRNYSRWENYVRFSFGPNFDEIKRGLDAIERVVSSF